MGQHAALQQLMASQQVWLAGLRAPAVAGMSGAAMPSGIGPLDAVLPQGGWPAAALTEILQPLPASGELQLLLPTVARLTAAGRRVVLVAPPFVPHAVAWRAAGIALRWLEIVEAAGQEIVWSLEQCLRSGSCAAVIGWPAAASHAMLRRLQVAAAAGQGLGFIVRHLRHAAQPSPAALRLQLLPGNRVAVLKCRGGALPACRVELPDPAGRRLLHGQGRSGAALADGGYRS